jgi:HK97 family phage major capsid protein
MSFKSPPNSLALAAELTARRAELDTQARAILNLARAEDRDITAEESQRFDRITTEMDTLAENRDNIVKFHADREAGDSSLRSFGTPRNEARAGDFVYADNGQRAGLHKGESFRSHERVAGHREPNEDLAVAQFGNLGNLVRSLTTSGGSAVVPQVWASQLIDLTRNKSAVLSAGATVVPMDAGIVKIGRLTGDPTVAFRTEGSSITASDPTFDNVTLTATTMSCLVKGSLEWFQDADNADQIVKNAISAAMAQKLDQVALYGGIIADAGTINLPTPPNPRGVLAALAAVLPGNILGAAANGTTQTAATFYAELLDVIFKVRAANEDPTGLIWNSKAARLYAGAAATDNQPLNAPGAVTAIPQFMSNTVPSYTKGTMTNVATDVFVADWTQLLVGQRLGVTIQVLTERYADTGEVGIVAHWRGDVQPAKPAAFAVYRALKGA